MEGTGEKKGRGRDTNGGASLLLYLSETPLTAPCSLVLINDRSNTSDTQCTVILRVQ